MRSRGHQFSSLVFGCSVVDTLIATLSIYKNEVGNSRIYNKCNATDNYNFTMDWSNGKYLLLSIPTLLITSRHAYMIHDYRPE